MMTTRQPLTMLCVLLGIASAGGASGEDLFDVLTGQAPEAKAPAAEALAEHDVVTVQWVGDSSVSGDVAPLLLPPSEYYEEAAEVVPPPAPQPEARQPEKPEARQPESGPAGALTLLDRRLAGVTVDAAPALKVAEQSQSMKEENRIRDLAAERFAAGTRFVSPGMPSPNASCWNFAWAAPALYHRPLLFEQPNVERYGHQAILWHGDRDTQSLVSGAHFFGSVATLPYKLGAYGCCEPEYVLGSYRPGTCNPHKLIKPRRSCRGLAAQTAAATGLVFFIP